jgi:hypothetical protein
MDLLIFLHPPVLFQDALYLARKRLVNLELHNLSLEDLTLCIALDELCPCSLLVVFLGHPVHLLLSAVCLELLCLAQSEVPSWILWASENQSPYRILPVAKRLNCRRERRNFVSIVSARPTRGKPGGGEEVIGIHPFGRRGLDSVIKRSSQQTSLVWISDIVEVVECMFDVDFWRSLAKDGWIFACIDRCRCVAKFNCHVCTWQYWVS